MLALEGLEGQTGLTWVERWDKRDSRQQQEHVQGPCGQKELTHWEMYLERREGRHRGTQAGHCGPQGGVWHLSQVEGELPENDNLMGP